MEARSKENFSFETEKQENLNIVLNIKSKKLAAFEAWRQRRMAELNRLESHADSVIESSTDSSSGSTSAPLLTKYLLQPLKQLPLETRSVNVMDYSQQNDITSPLLKSYGQSWASSSVEDEVEEILVQDAVSGDQFRKRCKLSKHNDSTFYPYIKCTLCGEWVCSRNRISHIESHLHYQPYRCSECGHMSRKEIFIDIHLRQCHGGIGSVVLAHDPELEKHAWALAEQCIQHTRAEIIKLNPNLVEQKSSLDLENSPELIRLSEEEILLNKALTESQLSKDWPMKSAADNACMLPANSNFHTGIVHQQRNLHSELNESGRGTTQLFVSCMKDERCCGICQFYVAENVVLLEDHVRSHLSEESFACPGKDCEVRHSSRFFLRRHIKLVHGMSKLPHDLLEKHPALVEEFLNLCRRCFASYFTEIILERYKFKYFMLCRSNKQDGLRSCRFSKRKLTSANDGNRTKIAKRTAKAIIKTEVDFQCLGCALKLRLFSDDFSAGCCACMERADSADNLGNGSVFCNLCSLLIPGDLVLLEQHAIRHMIPLPFGCIACAFTDWKMKSLVEHLKMLHPADEFSELFVFKWRLKDWKQIWRQSFEQCFVKIQEKGDFQDVQEKKRCALCLMEVVHTDEALYEHTRYHASVRKYACIFCNFLHSADLQLISDHIINEHPTMPVVIKFANDTPEIISERLRIQAACFPHVQGV
ncbi:putative zinc finger protein R05D3.3 [Trichinella zimbabwensis]|uniref:Putative zinc finger protein R05D3.3 n=1 Tax=Trichinella zimbabwensis TaxID=268475 RepID=A0A0V1I5S9_9BILA|nr:putative zinc finger protein R05D3.3 [Trichinella zimbabwensis]